MWCDAEEIWHVQECYGECWCQSFEVAGADSDGCWDSRWIQIVVNVLAKNWVSGEGTKAGKNHAWRECQLAKNWV